MKQAQQSIERLLININNIEIYNALDIFAREGNWQSFLINSKVASFEAWEINADYIDKLKLNLPSASVYCRDSIQFIRNASDYKKFNLLVIDNGLNCYGYENEYCEHFDVLPYIDNIIEDNCFVIFNVARKPFNYDDNHTWKNRRNEFYKVEDASDLSIKFLTEFYTKFFNSMGYDVESMYTSCRELHNDDDYLYHFGVQLKRK